MSLSTLLSPRVITLNFVDNYLETAYDKYTQYSDVLLHGDKFRVICRESRYDVALYNHMLLAIAYSILSCSTFSQCDAVFPKLHSIVYDDWKAIVSQLAYITDVLLPDLDQSTENNLLFAIDKLISFHVLGLECIIHGLLRHHNPKILRFLKNPLLLLCYPSILPHLTVLFLSLEELDAASQLVHWQANESPETPPATIVSTKSGRVIFIPNTKSLYHCLLPTLLQEVILFLLKEPVVTKQKIYYHWIEEAYNHKHDQMMIRFLLKACNDSPLPGTVKRWMIVLHIIKRFPSTSNLLSLFQDWLFNLSSSDANVLDPIISIMIYSSNKCVQLFEVILRFLTKALKDLADRERSRARRNLRTGMALLVGTKRYIPSSKYFYQFIPENAQRLYARLFERTPKS